MGETKSFRNFRVGSSPRKISTYALWMFVALAIAARLTLFPYVSEDATLFFLPWMQEFKEHGSAALGGNFANYNFPYLFLMYLGSLLPLEPLFAIKLVSLLGDCLLALALASVVRELQPRVPAPALAAILALFLPTVLLNASMWGQCDSIYTSFLLLSLRSVLGNKPSSAWLWWATALAFKLQAIFFLPALLIISLRSRYNLATPFLAGGLWALLSVPPLLFGRPLESIIGIYVSQTQDDRLVFGAANVYTWFPGATAAAGRWPAIAICGAVLALTAYAYWKGPDTAGRKVLFFITVAAVCPLLLPHMHDRYFFAAEVMSLLLIGHKKLFLTPWLFASSGLFIYILYFLSNQSAGPLILASIVQCFVVATLLRTLWRESDDVPTRATAVSP
jgi:Gpi18-like mannosyltransferase